MYILATIGTLEHWGGTQALINSLYGQL